MKKKIMNSLLIISIAYSIIIIVLMLCSYSTSINIIEFNDSNDNIKMLNNYKEELKNIESSACKNALSELINHYEETSFNGDVDLKNMYLNDKGVLHYATAIFNDCNLTDENKTSIGIKIITASIQFDEVLETLKFQYEIRVPDLSNRSILEVGLNTIRYNINRKNQLEAIKELIDILSKERNYE